MPRGCQRVALDGPGGFAGAADAGSPALTTLRRRRGRRDPAAQAGMLTDMDYIADVLWTRRQLTAARGTRHKVVDQDDHQRTPAGRHRRDRGHHAAGPVGDGLLGQHQSPGRYCITDVPPERWDPALYYDPDHSARDKTYSQDRRLGPEFDWGSDQASGVFLPR